MDQKELVELMIEDLLEAVAQIYGPDGLGKVVDQMKRMNRARDNSLEIDALESMLAGIGR